LRTESCDRSKASASSTLTRVLSGPHCTILLGDLGGEAIKVQRPVKATIVALPFQGDQAAYFLSINRSKKTSRWI
jgi:crotonobetainyl-CoA:carnitine CoA-transferase CaiB-like acyl-CoA transferase